MSENAGATRELVDLYFEGGREPDEKLQRVLANEYAYSDSAGSCPELDRRLRRDGWIYKTAGVRRIYESTTNSCEPKILKVAVDGEGLSQNEAEWWFHELVFTRALCPKTFCIPQITRRQMQRLWIVQVKIVGHAVSEIPSEVYDEATSLGLRDVRPDNFIFDEGLALYGSPWILVDAGIFECPWRKQA
jgi:hypothetical protein